MFLSVEENDYGDAVSLARRFHDLGLPLYATVGTADAIRRLGIDVQTVERENLFPLLESGKLTYLVYTGAVKDGTVGDYIALHRRAMRLGIPCLTSLDTASALAQMIAGRYNAGNTELVDLNDMRLWRQKIRFTKMHSCGNDYIFIENFDGAITCPESLCVELCRPHYGIGGDGIVLIERSRVADAKMRTYNRDGSEGKMAGNNLRCVGKYLYDNGYIRSETLTVETAGGVRQLKIYLRDGKVSTVTVDMGKADFSPKSLPALCDAEKMVDYPLTIGGTVYEVTCVSVGNPHCVVFCDSPDSLPLETLGPQFEYADCFPERINTEFVRVIDRHSLRVRVWERGNGETLACGTGACAAVAAAVENGLCEKGSDVTVRLPGGDLTVNYTDERILLTGSATSVYEGSFAY